MGDFCLKSSGHQINIQLAILLWVLALGWLAICSFLSSQTGEETGELSTAIARWIVNALGRSESKVIALNRALRKIAHVGCFFVLTSLMCAAAAATFPSRTYACIWPLLPCVAFSFLDEIRKANIPGRHCSIPEACLNALGCILGCLAVCILLWALRKTVNIE